MKLQPAPTPELQRLRAARLIAFKRAWKAYLANGYVEIIRKRDGQRRLVEQVKADLAEALWPSDYAHPAPPMTGRNQPGPASMNQHPYDVIKPEQVQAWIDVDPFVREGYRPRIAADLAYLDSFRRRP
jgi:hypothetical protein